MGEVLEKDGGTSAKEPTPTGLRPNGAYRWALEKRDARIDEGGMPLFLLEGWIRRQVRQLRCGRPYRVAEVVSTALRYWFYTQYEDRNLADTDGFLFYKDEMWPPDTGERCHPWVPLPASAADPRDDLSLSAIAWVGPIGVVAQNPIQTGYEFAEQLCADPAYIAAAGWFAGWMKGLSLGADRAGAARAAWSLSCGRSQEITRSIVRAMTLAKEGPRDAVPAELGTGWAVTEVVAIALWCVVTASDPLEALRLARSVDGDTGALTAMVGQAYGASLGDGWIPPGLMERVPRAEVMRDLAHFVNRRAIGTPYRRRRGTPFPEVERRCA